MNDDSKQGWRHWLPQWAPTFAVLAVAVPAILYLGGLDARLANVEAGLVRVETRMDAMETRMAALFADIRAELRDIRAEPHGAHIRAALARRLRLALAPPRIGFGFALSSASRLRSTRWHTMRPLRRQCWPFSQ